MRAQEKLPQNMHQLLMEIGEKTVLFRLFLLTKQVKGWEVYHNYTLTGCDILLVNLERNDRIRIEVKTRQKLYTTGRRPQMIRFQVTQNEYDNLDFLIGYLLDHNYFFILPKAALTPTSANGEPYYKFTAYVRADGSLGDNAESRKYLNKWDPILVRMRA